MLEFLASSMLWGAAAVAIPVALHLTGRAKPVLHRFAALRFLQRSHRSASRVLRLKHLLLLLLRMAAILLLALALARPLWPLPFAGTALPGQDLRGDFVLVLDASLSMRFQEPGGTRFELARSEALAFLDRLAPEARVALILATDEAEAIQGRLTLDQLRVRHNLERLQASGRGLDLEAALAAARRILSRDARGEGLRAILCFTDLQKSGLDRLRPGPTRPDPGEEQAAPALVLVKVGVPQAANGAVLSVRLPGPIVKADEPVTLVARIRALDPQRVTPVELYLDGLKIAQRGVEPAGSAEMEVQFTFPAGAPGPHSGSVVLAQNDGLILDQQRCLAYSADKPPRALIVEAPGEAGRPGSGHFLKAALCSPAALSVLGLSVTVAGPEALSAGRLNDYQVVLLADPGLLPEEAWALLKGFVTDGGGLFCWLGSRSEPLSLRRHGWPGRGPEGGLLPGRIGERVVAAAGQGLGLRPQSPGHPLLARLSPALQVEMGEVRVKGYTKVVPEAEDAQSAVVLGLTDGAPFLLEKGYGRGRVLVATVGPEPAGCDLPQRGELFVTLVLDACMLLSGRAEEASVRLGRALSLELSDPPADGQVAWYPPQTVQPTSLRMEPLPRGGEPKGPGRAVGTLVLPPLAATGIHRLHWKGAEGRPLHTRMLAVNPEPLESDLEQATHEQVERVLRDWKPRILTGQAESFRSGNVENVGRELPVPLLVAVLALLFLESFLSNRIYRAAGTEEEPAPNV